MSSASVCPRAETHRVCLPVTAGEGRATSVGGGPARSLGGGSAPEGSVLGGGRGEPEVTQRVSPSAGTPHAPDQQAVAAGGGGGAQGAGEVATGAGALSGRKRVRFSGCGEAEETDGPALATTQQGEGEATGRAEGGAGVGIGAGVEVQGEGSQGGGSEPLPSQSGQGQGGRQAVAPSGPSLVGHGAARSGPDTAQEPPSSAPPSAGTEGATPTPAVAVETGQPITAPQDAQPAGLAAQPCKPPDDDTLSDVDDAEVSGGVQWVAVALVHSGPLPSHWPHIVSLPGHTCTIHHSHHPLVSWPFF